MQDITIDAVNTLAEKLAALELTGDERAALDHLIERAAAVDRDVDVVGFSMPPLSQFSAISRVAKPIAIGLGMPILRLSTEDQNPG